MTATHYLVSSKGEEYFACRACTDVICDADHASCASLHGDGRRKCELRYDGCLDRQPLMVFWYDSTDVTNRRKMLSLSLLSPEGQRGTLYECERNHPSDVWPAAQRIGSGYSVKSAEKIAKRMGLARADA